MPKRYPAEFRRKVLDLVAAGRLAAQVAYDLDIGGYLEFSLSSPDLTRGSAGCRR